MPIIEFNNSYENIGIQTRKQTVGIELDMVKNFIEHKKTRFSEKPDKNLAIFIEPKINNAYPDIIFAEYNPTSYELWSKLRNELDIFDLKVLSFIYSTNETTSDEIINKLSIKYKGLLHSIEKLYDAKLICRQDSKWSIINKKFWGLRKIECVEAKISKWNEVFQQAVLNTTFSSESSVLSKVKRDPRDNIRTAFSNFGIGIYIYDDLGFSNISKPRKVKIPINHNSLLINEWIGRTLNQ